jgi:hypothetical protein
MRGGEVECGWWNVRTRWIAQCNVEMRNAKCRKGGKFGNHSQIGEEMLLGRRLRIIDFWRQPCESAASGAGKTRSRSQVGVAGAAGEEARRSDVAEKDGPFLLVDGAFGDACRADCVLRLGVGWGGWWGASGGLFFVPRPFCLESSGLKNTCHSRSEARGYLSAALHPRRRWWLRLLRASLSLSRAALAHVIGRTESLWGRASRARGHKVSSVTTRA